MWIRNLVNETSVALSLLVLVGVVVCNSASAMPPLPPLSTTPNDFGKGYRLGQRNGTILVDRLKQRTVDTHGCVAISDLESALLQVTRSVQSPVPGSTRLIGGFYQGYLDSIRNAIQEVRRDCDALSYSSGEFAGDLYGSLVCQVVSVNVFAVSHLELLPLYEGWSGGSSEVLSSCRSSIEATLTACAGDTSTISVEVAADAACSDTL